MGRQALDYVRFRKDNNMDFGRQQRQQRFLAALREQAMRWDLGLKLPSLITAMTDNIKTTISLRRDAQPGLLGGDQAGRRADTPVGGRRRYHGLEDGRNVRRDGR